MPTKEISTPYPLIDADPHASRVIRYFRRSDYVALAGATAAFPGLLYLLGYIATIPDAAHPADMMQADFIDPTHVRGRRYLKAPLIIGGVLGFTGGFLLAYQRSSFRFWGWAENEREHAMDLAELSERAKQGKPLYGESDQPAWVQTAAANNSTFSQLKFGAMPMFNLVHHRHHGTDPAKYGVSTESPAEK